MLNRFLAIPAIPTESFALWGPRQVGKSTFLKERFPKALRIDLLKAELFTRYTTNPERLREELLAILERPLVIIDEIQRVPALLEEIHFLIEEHQFIFGLCGSSLRKIKRNGANFLGGLATRYELRGLTAAEIGEDFNLNRALIHGYLPRHYLHNSPQRLINSYVSDYLQEEIACEGVVRNLPTFARFLEVAATSDTEQISFSNIARECGIASSTVTDYFTILSDTLIGSYLEAYRKRRKRELVVSPKFYFFDVGVVNALSRRGTPLPGSDIFGKALENWVHHELKSFIDYRLENSKALTYWRTRDGSEVDFLSSTHCKCK